jgi:hypothetical protein
VKARQQRKTLEGRLEIAQGRAKNALNVFEQAAQGLENTAEELHDLGTEAEVQRLAAQEVRDNADRQRIALLAKAKQLRELVQ